MGKKSKKNKNLFTIKQIILLFIVGVIALATIIAIALNPTGKKRQVTVENNTSLTSEFKTEKDVIEYYESIYYYTEASTEEGYDIDIVVSFKYNLYEEDQSKEQFFKNIYERISLVTGRKNFRLIDEGKGLTIAVKCSGSGITEVKINGETDYYLKHDSLRSAKRNFIAKTTRMTVDSTILSNLISASWNPQRVELGSKESSYYKYDVYFDEGYEIRSIQGRVYNIVFTKKYKEPVVDGYKVGVSLEKIKAALGVTYEEMGILGYKTKDFYVWFSEDEISIYPIYSSIDYKDFEELATEFNEKKDANEFMYKITDIWPDYDLYEYNENYVKLSYTNKGIQFEYSVEYPIGIKLYENYWGDLRDKIDDYPNIYYSFDKNLTGEREVERRETKIFYDDGEPEEDPDHFSKKFQLLMSYDGQRYGKIKIKSIDGSYPNNELEDYLTIDSYIWADDSHLIYGIYGEGIYIYDAEKRTTNQLASGDEPFEIKSYHRATNTMIYDDTTIKVDF